ncbi:MAG: inorganic phosphate transporter [Mariniblastus sp.]|nr:inorganic phosphate transporter [Mariniblastus sp.]
MGPEAVLIGLILLCGFYVAWNIGANDVANAMGTSVGSGALTLRRAVILAAIFEFSGAFIVGSNVSETVRKGIFDPGKLVERVYLEPPTDVKINSVNYLVDHGAEVKAQDPVIEFVTDGSSITILAPADGYFDKNEIKSETASDPPQFECSIETNRKEASVTLACGMIAALLAAGTWLLIATWMSWPVSTTHSIVGAVVGFGCVSLGASGVAWNKVGFIASGWLVSPLISGVIAYLVFGILLKTVFHKRDPVAASKRVAPKLVFVLMFVMTGMTCYKGLKPLWKRWDMDPKDPSFMVALVFVACVLGLIGYLVTKFFVRDLKSNKSDSSGGSSNPALDAEISRSLAKTIKHLQRVRNSSDGEMQESAAALLSDAEALQDRALHQITTNTDSAELQQVERVFTVLQIFTACLVAFAHGSNDVANAIGPLSAAYQAINEGAIAAKSSTPLWALLLGGFGIVVGLWTWGWKVIKTVGEKITELTPSRGFCAEFAAAITILLASVLPFGLPISTTHTLVGAVLGVGLARGINALNLKTMRDIVAGWIITIPAGAGLCILFYFIMRVVFIDSGWAIGG